MSTGLARTYRLETSPAPAMEWEEYERLLDKQWRSLLDSNPSPSERSMQTFLERHPAMLPGAFNITGNESGHSPSFDAVISQPVLPSYDLRVPDFMWISHNSEEEQPVLIEIEAPGKNWFTKSGRPTSDFTQAINQITEWKAWLGITHNVEAFRAFYGLDRENWRRRRFRPAFVLIYGRRAEASVTPDATSKRSIGHADDIVTMTYDRLKPNPKAKQLLCLRVNKAHQFVALSVPPTLKLGPSFARSRAQIIGIEKAIAANKEIPQERQRFLIRRLPYWSAWSSSPDVGVISSLDAE